METTRDLLDRILRGELLDGNDVLGLLRTRTREDARLEYKRGEWIDKGSPVSTGDPRDVPAKVRKYISGFANTEGGLLLVGVAGGEDSQAGDQWSVVGCPHGPKDGWQSWAGQVLSGIAARVAISIQKIVIGSDTVLAIAVNRAQNLIEIVEQSKIVRYIRVDEHTVQLTDTLYADFVLGRRSVPDLTLSVKYLEAHAEREYVEIRFYVEVHNDGLVWVPDSQIAIVGFTNYGGRPLTESIRRHTEVREQQSDAAPGFGPRLHRHMTSDAQAIKPFEVIQVAFHLRIPVVADRSWRWRGAAMVNPSNGAPIWVRVDVHGKGTTSEGISERVVGGERPTIAWESSPSVPSA